MEKAQVERVINRLYKDRAKRNRKHNRACLKKLKTESKLEDAEYHVLLEENERAIKVLGMDAKHGLRVSGEKDAEGLKCVRVSVMMNRWYIVTKNEDDDGEFDIFLSNVRYDTGFSSYRGPGALQDFIKSEPRYDSLVIATICHKWDKLAKVFGGEE